VSKISLNEISRHDIARAIDPIMDLDLRF